MTEVKNNTTKQKEASIHSTHGKDQLLFVRALVNGVLCAAYVKNGELVSYEPWEAINKQMYTGPCLEFTLPETNVLEQPTACCSVRIN